MQSSIRFFAFDCLQVLASKYAAHASPIPEMSNLAGASLTILVSTRTIFETRRQE